MEASLGIRKDLWDEEWPWNRECERAAIGAVLLAPEDHAARIVSGARADQFYDLDHAWVWDRMRFALLTKKVVYLPWWIRRDDWCGRYRQRHGKSLVRLLSPCLADAFWWHGHWYVSEVVRVWRVRERLVKQLDGMKRAIDAAREYRA